MQVIQVHCLNSLAFSSHSRVADKKPTDKKLLVFYANYVKFYMI